MVINRLFENRIFLVVVILAFALAVGLNAAYSNGAVMKSSALFFSAPVQLASNNPNPGPDPWSTLASNNPNPGPDPWSTLTSNNPNPGPDPWSTLASNNPNPGPDPWSTLA
ncbi:MAG TPA: hypothetical protein VMA31_14490 [Bryobacteraceae bacterium]|nr:hypothetical protein [Bryobacteraceae bacterium]